MSVKELEQRVIALENQIKQLQSERAPRQASPGYEWEATVEKFKNDEHLLAVLRDAMKLREKERTKVRNGRAKTRRNAT